MLCCSFHTLRRNGPKLFVKIELGVAGATHFGGSKYGQEQEFGIELADLQRLALLETPESSGNFSIVQGTMMTALIAELLTSGTRNV